MSIKPEILTLQYIRMDLALKIAEIERAIKATKESYPDYDTKGAEHTLGDLQELYQAVSHELQTNTAYTRPYPALCAIAMPESVKEALLGNPVEDNEK